MKLEIGVTAEERAIVEEYINELKLEIEISDDAENLLLCVAQPNDNMSTLSVEPIGEIPIKETLCRCAYLLNEQFTTPSESRMRLFTLAGNLREVLSYIEELAKGGSEIDGSAHVAQVYPIETASEDDDPESGEKAE